MLSALFSLVFLAQGAKLEGVVRGNDERPLPGASVYVARARPRRGVGVL